MSDEIKLKWGSDGLCCRGCGRQDHQLNTYDYLADIPGNEEESDLVEVQFKNTRKGYYRNSNHIPLEKGDIVAVEASPGHDIGVVTLMGRLVPLQMRKANLRSDAEIKRIYRKAKAVDMEKYEEAKKREHETMIRSRQIANDLNLNMKIGDVEFQGDGNKAIFYYIADERVDFRQLIKVLAEAFKVRIEMRQIGARQEAGRIGGIGPCGRELCCATWMTNFVSVATSAARFQDLSLNPQKLAGQCAKLKCCLNYEVDIYVEAANLVELTARRAFEVISMNRRGEKPENLNEDGEVEEKRPVDLLEQENINRFDRAKKKKKKKGGGNKQVAKQPDEVPQSVSNPQRENRGKKHQNGNRGGNNHRKPQTGNNGEKTE